MSQKTFPIKDKLDTLFPESDYWKWLESNNVDNIHKVNTKLAYLGEQGFVKGVDFLTPTDLTILSATEDAYFYKVLRPILDKKYNINR